MKFEKWTKNNELQQFTAQKRMLSARTFGEILVIRVYHFDDIYESKIRQPINSFPIELQEIAYFM